MDDADYRFEVPVASGARDTWRALRLRMEAGKEKHTPRGVKEHRHWDALKHALAVFGVLLRLVGLYRRGVRNACDIRLNRLDLAFEALPPAFDGYRILQLSDPHVDHLPETWEAALALAAREPADLCVLTGDYRRRVSGPYEQIRPAFETLAAMRPARDGIVAVLGNHDCAGMVDLFDEIGIETLINETRTVRRKDAELHLTGTDDVHYYYTDAAREALETAPAGFKIALVHSAELADVAAAAGHHLYLCGHTHGGQISLPGGFPLITHMVRNRRLSRGLWRIGGLTGYTSTGSGVSGLPVRFNTRGEVTLITLRRA